MSQTKTKGIEDSAVTSVKVADGTIANADLENMATQTIKGRTTAGSGAPEDLTAIQATAILNSFVGDSGSGGTKGLVPAPAADDTKLAKFLRANGLFELPFDPEKVAFQIEDFVGNSALSWANVSTGTGATFALNSSSINQNHPGAIATTTGSTSTGRGAGSSGTLKLGAGLALVHAVISVDTLSTVTDEYFCEVGLTDESQTSNKSLDGMWLRYDRLTDGANWQVMNGNGTTATKTDSGIPVVASTNYHFYALVNSANSSVKLYIDGALIATHTTNISSNSNVRPSCKIVKSAGTASLALRFDLFMWLLTFNTAR